MESLFGSRIRYLLQQRSLQFTLLLWVVISVFAVALCHGSVPLPDLHAATPAAQVITGSIVLIILLLLIGIIAVLARHRPMPDLAQRAADRTIALRETVALWCYGAIVILAGRFIGVHLVGRQTFPYRIM
jgi:hypothetical protein